MKKLFVSLVLALSFGTAFAESTTYNCKLGTLSRDVEITSEAAPCQVIYNGAEKWSAKHEAGYCKKMGETFVEKLKADGWKCELAAALAPQATEAEKTAPAAAAPAPAETVNTPAAGTVQEEAAPSKSAN